MIIKLTVFVISEWFLTKYSYNNRPIGYFASKLNIKHSAIACCIMSHAISLVL